MSKIKELIVDDTPSYIDRAEVEQDETFKFLGVNITNKLSWSTHQDSREEGTTMPIPSMETEKIWHGSSDPQKVLKLHNREHPDWLHHHLVWQLFGIQPQGATEGSMYGPVHLWSQASCRPVLLYQAVSAEGPKNWQRVQPP
jgi:hypothetical protein